MFEESASALLDRRSGCLKQWVGGTSVGKYSSELERVNAMGFEPGMVKVAKMFAGSCRIVNPMMNESSESTTALGYSRGGPKSCK